MELSKLLTKKTLPVFILLDDIAGVVSTHKHFFGLLFDALVCTVAAHILRLSGG